jgi:hypothetical protein
MKANLYKCFMPVGWKLAGNLGVVGYLHPESPYEDPDGGALREELYSRLRAHFQCVNELALFAEVHHLTKYSVNLYGPPQAQPGFDHLANLFVPATVDACYAHDGTGTVVGYKNDQGKWNTLGHADRIVRITDGQLAVFAQLYDEPGTPARRARLPALHAGKLSSVLATLAANPRRLADLGSDYFQTPSTCWNEKNAKDVGTIVRNADRSASFASTPEDWVLSGPHFYLANPFNKTPRRICSANGHYDSLDLHILPDDYLPRTIYRPMANRSEYRRRIPRVSWSEPEWVKLTWDELTSEEQKEHDNQKERLVSVRRWRQKMVTEYFRVVNREMLGPSAERSLITTLIPPDLTWVHSVVGNAFKSTNELIGFLAYSQSIPIDFRVKSTGVGHANTSLLSQLPIPETLTADLAVRALSLS